MLFCLLVLPVFIAGCVTKSPLALSGQTGNISAEIEGFRNGKGEAIVSLFSAAGGFPEDMERALQNMRLKIESGRVRAVFESVPYGEYALCVLHDEDGDSRMKSNWLGQPREGFGFSGLPDYSFGPPDFADAAFLLISEGREIVIRMRYNTARREKQNERRSGQAGKR